MDFSAVCRTCLGDEYLNPVFPNKQDRQRYSNAIYVTTGIKIEPDDGFPQQICSHCIHFINQALKFRKTCKDAQIKLLENIETVQENNEKEILDNDMLVFSGNDSNIKEKEIDYLNFSESNEYETEYIEYETITDDEEDKLLLSSLNEEEIHNVNTETASSTADCDLYSTDDTALKNNRVVCKLCQKNLSIRSIDAHMDKAHPGADERKIKCELCNSYLQKQKMARHLKMKHGIQKGHENKGRCGYCKTEFDNKIKLIEHVANCTAKKKKRKVYEASRELVECDICNKSMQRGSLKLHKAMAHAGMKPVCEHCGCSFGTKFRLNEHYRAKHGYDKFKCSDSDCDFETASKVSLQNHTRKHLKEKPFECETCDAKFHAAYLLAQHKQSHRTERPYTCDVCSASFKSGNSLHIHKKACHSPAVFKCAMCPKSFSCRFYAVKHMRRTHRFSGPVPELPKVADNSVAVEETDEVVGNSLHIHKKACHSPAVYRCAMCPKSFSCRFYAVKHMRRTHRFSGPVPELPKVAEDGVDQVEGNSLHIHKKACHSPAVYRCAMCPKSFSCRFYAVKHMRRTHRFSGPVPELPKVAGILGIFVYRCAMCPKSFSCWFYAVKHMRLTHRFSGPVPELPKVTDNSVEEADDHVVG
ncbi:zinc-finger associated domain (zf-AD) domain-containing protein [Phthorimaea operculella]|nr:zinc-finger associated domain (zf-AD) domain-containing protein [Phthorimaea operculella]